MESSEHSNWIKLSFIRIKIIMITHLLFFFFGIAFIIFTLFSELRLYLLSQELSFFSLSIYGSIGMSLSGSSIYYLRKLYKMCIQNKIVIPNINNISDLIQQFGVTLYFILRPLFSTVLAVLVVIAIKSGVFVITSNKNGLSEGFVYLSMFISFFCGFSSGELIKSIEKYGSSIFDNLINNSGGNKNAAEKNENN